MPATSIADAFGKSNLDFVPCPLRVLSIASLIFCCLVMIAALIYCAVWPSKHNGLWKYDGAGTSRYFVFQYLPQLIAALLVIWLQVIQNAIQRTFPFAALASGRGAENSGILYDAKTIRTKYLLPDLSFFRHQELLLGFCTIIFWLVLYTVPLQSCLFQTRYFPNENTWRWTTSIGVA